MKDVFEALAASDGIYLQKEQNDPSSGSVDLMVRVIGMIMHKIYEFDIDAVAYKFEEDGIIAFRHVSAAHVEEEMHASAGADDEEDMDLQPIAANYHPHFYQCMRHFLQELDDLESDIVVSPNELRIGVRHDLDLLNALEAYLKKDGCPLKTADNAVIDLSHMEKKTPARVYCLVQEMSQDGEALSKEDPEAFEYFMVSAERDFYISQEHFFANVAARAYSDIPISLNQMRREIVTEMKKVEEAEDPALEYVERKINPQRDFGFCAKLEYDPDTHPLKENPQMAMISEMHIQIAKAAEDLLRTHYGLDYHFAKGIIQPGIVNLENGLFDLAFTCENLPSEKAGAYFKNKLIDFGKDLRTAAGDDTGIAFVPASAPALLVIRYSTEALFKALTRMVATKYPENEITLSHLCTANHVKARLDSYTPANSLN